MTKETTVSIGHRYRPRANRRDYAILGIAYFSILTPMLTPYLGNTLLTWLATNWFFGCFFVLVPLSILLVLGFQAALSIKRVTADTTKPRLIVGEAIFIALIASVLLSISGDLLGRTRSVVSNDILVTRIIWAYKAWYVS